VQTTITPTTDNVTTVRRFFEAWTDCDVDALVTLVDPNVVCEPLLGVLYQRDFYEGLEGIAGAFREVDQRWHRYELLVEDAQPAGDHVIAHVRLDVGKHGMAAALDLMVVCRMRRGRIISLSEAAVALAA